MGATRGKSDDLFLGNISQGCQPFTNGVRSDELLGVMVRYAWPRGRALGDELRGCRARCLHVHLLGSKFGLLAGQQDLHGCLRAGRSKADAFARRRLDQGKLAQSVETVTDLLLRESQAGGQLEHPLPRVAQHGPVNGLRFRSQSQDVQHPRTPK
ncbi:hypothetical protein ACWELO_33700 [Streptomyces sp. NPDC004596]